MNMYYNNEITNEATIFVLENIKRELKNNLSSVEINAIDKGIKNTKLIENVYLFINNLDKECSV